MKEKEMRPIVEKWLRDNGFSIAREVMIGGYCDLAGFRFAQRTSRRIPELLSVVTVELKVNDILGVTRQAMNNNNFVHYSWAAMPLDKCKGMRTKTIERFRQKGVGLLSVDSEVKVVVMARYNKNKNLKWMMRKLWRWQPAKLRNYTNE